MHFVYVICIIYPLILSRLIFLFQEKKDFAIWIGTLIVVCFTTNF